MSDLYATIGLTKGASAEDIKKAYRKLAREHHPDRNPGDAEAERKFKEIQAAYEILSDPQKKSEYDQFGSVRNQPRGSPFHHGKPFSSVFDDFFNHFMHEQRRALLKGEDIVVQVSVSLQQLLKGDEIEITYQRNRLCSKCKGSGGENVVCSECNGAGGRVMRGPNSSIHISCQVCYGTGCVVGDSCKECDGGFLPAEDEKIVFQVPPGTEDGMRFIRKGRGQPCPNPNGTPGDLFIVVYTTPNNLFQRAKNGSILSILPLSFAQLALGTTIDVFTIDGTKVSLKIPSGTQPNTKFRLKNLGLPIFNNSMAIYSRGDHLVEINLEVPKDPQGRYRELLQEMASLADDTTPAMKEYQSNGDKNG